MPSPSANRAWNYLLSAWIVAVVATLGSLFFSDVMQYQPCVLCWYQRIAMYPLILVLLIGLFPFDSRVLKFALPQVIVGIGIAFYHNLLYYKLISESAAPCAQGISCTTAHIEWFGFITIPLLSLLAFILIFILLYFVRKHSHEE